MLEKITSILGSIKAFTLDLFQDESTLVMISVVIIVGILIWRHFASRGIKKKESAIKGLQKGMLEVVTSNFLLDSTDLVHLTKAVSWRKKVRSFLPYLAGILILLAVIIVKQVPIGAPLKGESKTNVARKPALQTQYYTVKIFLPARLRTARILVDNERPESVRRTLNISYITVRNKPSPTSIKVVDSDGNLQCTQVIRIRQNNQNIWPCD